MVNQWRARWLVMMCLGVVLGLGLVESARAQSSPDIDVQNFEPKIGPHGIFTVEGASTIGHLEPWGGLMFNYSSEPVVSELDDGTTESVVDDQFALDLRGAIGFFDRAQLGVHMPFYLANDVTFGGNALSGATFGDLSIQPKATLLDRRTMPLGLGLLVDITVPTGEGDAFVGASGPTVTPELLVDDAYGPVVLAGNLGVRFQEERRVRNLNIGHELTYRVGAKYRFIQGLLHVGGELYGETPLADFGAAKTSPVEGLLGVDIVTDIGLVISGGAGGGFASGVGAPEFRAFLGVSYPGGGGSRDSDGDGIRDREDRCPDDPEDPDGFEDMDGCPDPDNDGDTIKDRADQCPNEPEDKDGDRDQDGCPDEETPEEDEDEEGASDTQASDRDGDGTIDANDECPRQPGLMDRNGCPPVQTRALLSSTRIRVRAEIRFETESADLKGPSTDILDEVGLILRTNEELRKIEIQGHADARGTDEFNQELSERRAQSVKDYLVEESGIAPDRLVAKGYGEKLPAAPNTSPENLARNRRVAFKILEQGEETGDTKDYDPSREDVDVDSDTSSSSESSESSDSEDGASSSTDESSKDSDEDTSPESSDDASEQSGSGSENSGASDSSQNDSDGGDDGTSE